VITLIKDIPKEDRPRERLIKLGVDSLSNEELIAILFNTGNKEKSAKSLALDLLSNINNIQDLNKINLNILTSIKGVGLKKAATLIAAVELGRRVNSRIDISKEKFTSPKLVYDYYYSRFHNLNQEHFYIIYLDVKKKIISDKLLYIGTLNSSVVHPREIFKEAYLLSAAFIICVHNHPSGDSNPSQEDLDVTKKIIEVGNLLGIKLIDHIIIGTNYYSFYENNFI
jgi:DNA repair protein RadC